MMVYTLPKVKGYPIPMTHFPTRHQAFIFRACEYVSTEKIAKLLNTNVENVKKAMDDMGLPNYQPDDIWLKRGYITIIRRMWHILPYDQLLKLLDVDEQTLARIMQDDDFLNIKLSDKPECEKVTWRELTEEEKSRTAEIKAIMKQISPMIHK